MRTNQQVLIAVRVLLGRVSELALPDDDILKEVNDLCQEYVQELSLNLQDRRTTISLLTLTPAPDTDWVVNMPNVPDFEPERLEYANTTGETFQWREAPVVPLSSWSRHYSEGYVAAAFYGTSAESTPARVRLALLDEQVPNLQFRLTYREPLLRALQSGDKPPIPMANVPMLEREAAIRCMPLVQDKSGDWKEWVNKWMPLYVDILGGQKKLWREYLDTSMEPQVQPIARSDRAAQSTHRPVRPYIPLQ